LTTNDELSIEDIKSQMSALDRKNSELKEEIQKITGNSKKKKDARALLKLEKEHNE